MGINELSLQSPPGFEFQAIGSCLMINEETSRFEHLTKHEDISPRWQLRRGPFDCRQLNREHLLNKYRVLISDITQSPASLSSRRSAEPFDSATFVPT